MWKKRDLTKDEKSNIIAMLSKGGSTITIAKNLKRDHSTIKRFIETSQDGRKKKKKSHFVS